MRWTWLVAFLAAFVLADAACAQPEETAAQLQKRGQALLTKNCGRCHAIGTSGLSRRPDAPPFRAVMRRYSPEALEEALGEGLSTGHEAMPEFVFQPDEIAAIVGYLDTLHNSR